MKYVAPYSVQIELCKGCTRSCYFCGINSIGNKPYKFMSIELATNVAEQLGSWFPKKRLEFAMRGEPTLNPNAPEIISIFRKNFPKAQLMLTTNGDIIKKNPVLITQLFNSGLNLLMVDAYERYYWWWDFLIKTDYPLYDFHKDKPTVYGYKGFDHHEIVLTNDISTMSGKDMRKVLNNQAGNVYCSELGLYPLRYPLRRRCSNPFRELVIFHDGKIPLCCMDYKEELIVGKTPEQSLQDIWSSDLYNAIRVLLYHKQRVFAPCTRCDYKGYRLGLLQEPDGMSVDEAKEIVKQRTDIKKEVTLGDF